MEQEKLQPIDLEVLSAQKSHFSNNTLKIFNKLEKKGLCDQWVINKKRECDKKNNFYKVCYLNELGKNLCIYLKALKAAKNHKKG